MPSPIRCRARACVLGFLVGLSAAEARAQNMILNGGFEDPAVPADDADGGLLIVAPAVLPGGWSVSAGSIDVLRRDGATPFVTPEGVQAVDLTGMGSRGVLRRTLDATGEAVYRLSFWIAGNPTCEPGLKRVNFLLENTIFASLAFDTTGRSPTNMGWTSYEYAFAGTDEPRILQFQSTTGTNCGIMLDDVRLEKCLEIVAHPMAQTRCEGTPALFTVGAEGAGAQYRWRRNGSLLSNGGTISGATSPTLMISWVAGSDAGSYSCQVFNDCGELSTHSATLAVVPSGCPGDADGDGGVNFNDITRVLEFWNFNYAPGTGAGDVTCDGVVAFTDITRVLENWGSACR
ncbi:MAG: DUF642 domain-containing protein [Phycisphaerae bacterium]|nr:DUF642 domain-containing protein [Phycisphaerae bacterium]